MCWMLRPGAGAARACRAGRVPIALLACVLLGASARADEPAGASASATAGSEGDHDVAAAANNPLANLKAFNVQNYYIPELTGTDGTANQLWFRYAQPIGTPIGDFLVRASLPLVTVPTGVNTSESGLGDSNVFATWLIDVGNPAISVGVGPLAGFPTATADSLGTDQWTLGAAAVYFDARSQVVQWGALVTYSHKVGGSSRLPPENVLTAQPFGFVQVGKGFYFRSAPIWVFDLESGDYHVPIGLGAGKIVKVGSTVLNFFVEPQFTVLESGPGRPKFQLFAALNLQFYGR
jgi:hypothetical protein